MPKRKMMKTATLIMAIVLAFAICAAQAAEVKLLGQINKDGKGIMADDGKQYTIIPAEEIEGKLADLEGKRVQLSGVVYQSHGRNMITALSLEMQP